MRGKLKRIRYQVSESNVCKRRLSSFMLWLRDACVETGNCLPQQVPRVKLCLDLVIFIDDVIAARAFIIRLRGRRRPFAIKYINRTIVDDEAKKAIDEIVEKVMREARRMR